MKNPKTKPLGVYSDLLAMYEIISTCNKNSLVIDSKLLFSLFMQNKKGALYKDQDAKLAETDDSIGLDNNVEQLEQMEQLIHITKHIQRSHVFGKNEENRRILLELLILNEFVTEELVIVVTNEGKSYERNHKKRILTSLGRSLNDLKAITVPTYTK